MMMRATMSATVSRIVSDDRSLAGSTWAQGPRSSAGPLGIVRMVHGFLPLLQRSAAPVVVNVEQRPVQDGRPG